MYDELDSVFGPDLRVIDADVGHAGPFTSTMHCNIRPAEFSLMSKFLNARCTTGDITKTMCISLVCYSAEDLANARGAKEQSGAWEQVLLRCRPVAWPNRGPLSALVNDKIPVPLSAPMKVCTSTNHMRFYLVDDRAVCQVFDNVIPISSFLKAGKNRIQIRQQANLSDFIFFLVAHHPIRGQLKEIAEVRKQEMEWARYVHGVCRPPETVDEVWERFKMDLKNL
ncbi:hypothetical protein DENSPDRAFT_574263 [Dentipellis sp. KUC8613]|nr:hypothetical protein DENSPDRAFT_574263 [Dentipellis sp. KUC8613]